MLSAKRIVVELGRLTGAIVEWVCYFLVGFPNRCAAFADPIFASYVGRCTRICTWYLAVTIRVRGGKDGFGRVVASISRAHGVGANVQNESRNVVYSM